jgi:23S rRNA pseudouridine2605 synthase
MESPLAEKQKKGERAPSRSGGAGGGLPKKPGWSPTTDAGRPEPRPALPGKAAGHDDEAASGPDGERIAPQANPEGERIAKVIARAGLCSRRDAEKMVLEGRVKVDGAVIASPARNVTGANLVTVDDKPLKAPEAARMWRYHKPSGLVTTHKDEKGRPTVFASLPAGLGRVVSVGRLDFNSEGLLLLTNDGEIARRMEIPATGWTRVYRARLFGKVTQKDLDRLATGVTIDGVKYGPIVANLERAKGVYAWASVSLKEGKNREVKRVMESLGLKVARLIRTAYGPFQLGQLAPGGIEEIPARLWREKLGIGRKKR